MPGGRYHVKSASMGARFLTISSGYGGGNSGVEVYAGKLNSSFTGFEGWARITNDNQLSYTPDM